MSEFSELDLPQEVVECMDAFDIQRQMVYNWIGGRTAQDVSVFSYANKVGELVSGLSEVFAETSSTIIYGLKDEQRIARYLIASAWFTDTGDRLNFLTKRMPSYVELSTVERADIENKVSSILDESGDQSDIYNSLGQGYFIPAAEDFGQFLSVFHRERERRMCTITANISDGQPDALTYEVTAEELGATTARNEAVWLAEYLRRGNL